MLFVDEIFKIYKYFHLKSLDSGIFDVYTVLRFCIFQKHLQKGAVFTIFFKKIIFENISNKKWHTTGFHSPSFTQKITTHQNVDRHWRRILRIPSGVCQKGYWNVKSCHFHVNSSLTILVDTDLVLKGKILTVQL